MGNYHPHGDAAIYDALVRMAQDFTLRYPLVDGQGNFGSVDGDPPAAMRYTEARLRDCRRAARRHRQRNRRFHAQLRRDRRKSPTVLPTRVPNLLVNGSSGIAVGMATNIPPHNLTRSRRRHHRADRTSPDTPLEEVLKIVPGPDFPTGGSSAAATASSQAYNTGRGTLHACAPRPPSRSTQGPRSDHRHRDSVPGQQAA